LKHKILILSFALLTLSGCDFLKRKFGSSTQPSVETPPQVQLATTELCASDATLQSITGTCSGSWSVTEKDDFKLCEFTYDGERQCPEGMLSSDGQVVCRGSYRKKIGVSQNITTGEECANTFGVTPKAADYTLSCCAK
jgi:hypothetical protein